MPELSISRRVFLAAAGAAGLSSLVGCGSGGSSAGGETNAPYATYRLSTKGRRASRAAKINAANKLFATPAAAELGRAHPGDNSAVVPVDLSEARWMQYFGAGVDTIDLRRV